MSSMIKTERTNSNNEYFKCLVKELDAYLKITDGDEHDFYNQFNHIDVLKNVVIAKITTESQEQFVGCGAIKHFDANTMEIKRMYVTPTHRGLGIALKIIRALETWAKELGYQKCILETGKRQVEAVRFYEKCDYQKIPNYGQYQKMENSVCFEKLL